MIFFWLKIILVLFVQSSPAVAKTPGDVAERLMARERRQLPTEISIQITAPLFSSRLFDYGIEYGDDEIPPSLDVGKRLQLNHPLGFLGDHFRTIFILSNGAIGFDSTSRSYRANIFPGDRRLIAPFWNRNDMRNGGRVYYREITEGRILERGQSEIRYQYDKEIQVLSCLLVTWENMQPLGEVLPDENTNTFQAAIFIANNGTFANFIYSNIGWTQGAEAGFSQGVDGNEFYTLPTSGTGNVMYLEQYGNTGIPGEWIFEIDMSRIIRCKPDVKGDTCDEQCENNEWGYDCVECCHCENGVRCEPTTGRCPGLCAQCWLGAPFCQDREQTCRIRGKGCAHNAIAFTDYDRCGEPTQRCECLSGYEGDGRVGCRDIDECLLPDSCHPNALCTNTPGRFFCQCEEGFSGDGVYECKTSFLYPYDKHQLLPKSKYSKVAWQLRYPLKIFGVMRNRITISTQGLISMRAMPKLDVDQNLDELVIEGFAPFFAPINIVNGGRVSVEETTSSDVLTRATKTISDNYFNPSFIAGSVLTISYLNVTVDRKNKPGNTFQANLIGGTNSIGNNVTFLQLLYRDLIWSEGAQAMILTGDASNSVVLPGSGTDGITQLTRLSNIQSPGIWLYRMDTDMVFPCPQPNLQPPYCDAQAVPNIPIRQSRPNRPRPITTIKMELPITTQTLPRTTTTLPITTTTLPTTTARRMTTTTTTLMRTTATIRHSLPVYLRPSVKHGQQQQQQQSVEITFPPFITVIPQLFTPSTSRNDRRRPDLIIPQVARDRQPSRSRIVTIASTSSVVTSTTPTPTRGPKSRLVLPPGLKPAEPRRPSRITDQNFLPPFIHVRSNIRIPADENAVRTPEPPTFTRIETRPEEPRSSVESEATTVRPLFVFTTPKRVTRPVVPTRASPVIVTAIPTRTHIGIPFSNDVRSIDAGSRRGPMADDSSNKLAIIIPTTIVGVWLLLLLIIALVVCCRKRRSRRHVHGMYGPTYQVRQYPAGYTERKCRDQGGYPAMHGSYEDQLDKAVRMSSEMSSYNQNGRVSLYNSYWNLAGSSDGRSNGGFGPYCYTNKGYYDSCPEFQRYNYAGRY